MEAGEIVGEPTIYRTLWAERTEEAGRDNLYASRMVHENEVVYTVLWVNGIEPSMLLKFNNDVRPISAITSDGFRKKMHIKVTKSDANYEAGY